MSRNHSNQTRIATGEAGPTECDGKSLAAGAANEPTLCPFNDG